MTHTLLVVYSDGASKGNPGPAGAGWVVCSAEGDVLKRGHAFLGVATNNEAEYRAAVLGLEEAQRMGAREVVLRADSELLIKQLQGVYQVRHPTLIPLYHRIKNLVSVFHTCAYEHVRRHLNAAADEQANLAIAQQKLP
jgi:ribonuclease HI